MDPKWQDVVDYVERRCAALTAATMETTTTDEQRRANVDRYDELRMVLWLAAPESPAQEHPPGQAY